MTVSQIVSRRVVSHAAHEDQVASVGSAVQIRIRICGERVRIWRSTLSIVASAARIVIAACPLEMNHVIHIQLQLQLQRVGDEAALRTGIHLHDVSALATHIHIENRAAAAESTLNAADVNSWRVSEIVSGGVLSRQRTNERTDGWMEKT